MSKQLSTVEIKHLIQENEKLQRENRCLRQLTSSKRFKLAEIIADSYNQLFPLDTHRRAITESVGRSALKRHTKHRQKTYQKKVARIQKLLDGHDKIMVINSITYDSKLQQRPQHLANGFTKLGYFVIYLEPTNYVNEFRKINQHLITINKYKFIKDLKASKKYFLQPSTMPTPITDLEDVKSWGYHLVYDYIDELNEDISGDLVSQLAIWDSLIDLRPLLCITTAQKLSRDLSSHLDGSCPIIMAPNGVNIEHFDYQTQDESVPSDLRKIKETGHSIIGFYGALAPWIDFALINAVAKHHPDWEIVLIGMNYGGAMKDLKPAPNIHYLGTKDYNNLVDYSKHFDCAILPFLTGEIAKATSPVKLFEYMATGLPTVCTRDLDECKGYDYVYMAKDNNDFEAKLAKAIEDKKDPKKRARLLEQAKENTWEKRVAVIDSALKKSRKS